MEQKADAHEATLDAREIDGEPFEAIMDGLATLSEDGSFLLINSFEPEPLYDVLQARGFTHETEQVGPQEYHVEIRHA